MNNTATETNNQALIERAEREWSEIAKESLTVEQISGALYAYGSELACLRLYHKWQGGRKVRAAYSENLKTWYFRVEMF